MGVLDTFSLKGKVALVTGGAGLYGRQIVEALAEAGATTITASRNIEKLQAFADSLTARGLDVRAKQVDLARVESIGQLCDAVIADHGRVDILVNNAVLRIMKADTYDPEGWTKSMQVNATGLYAITERIADDMIRRKSGSIINIGSIQGMVGIDLTLYEGTDMNALMPDYFFHKGGMLNYTRYLAGALGRYGIRANCLAPGGYFNNQHETFLKNYCDRTVLGRMANDTDLKGAIVFLASDASAYVTGTNLPVDGGYTAK